MVSLTLYFLLLILVGILIGSYSVLLPIRHNREWTVEAKEFLELGDSCGESGQAWFEAYKTCPYCSIDNTERKLFSLVGVFLRNGKCTDCCKAPLMRNVFVTAIYLVVCLPLYFITNDFIGLTLITIFWSSLFVGILIDMENKYIPDGCCLMGLGSAFSYHLYVGAALEVYVIGAMVGYALIYGARQIIFILTKIEGIGLGDAKLLAALLAFLGVDSIVYVWIGATGIGIFYHVLTRTKRGEHIAFGPSLYFASAGTFYYAQFLS